MVRGGVASLGPSSLAAAASLGLQQQLVGSRFMCWALGSRSLATQGTQSATPAKDQLAEPGADLRLTFSLRPSVLSPLFPVWDQTRQSAQRRDHLVAVLDAHMKLAEVFRPAKDGPASADAQAGAGHRFPHSNEDAALAGAVRRRARNIRQTADQLGTLVESNHGAGTGSGLEDSCPGPSHAAAYCTALERAALYYDPGVHAFKSMQSGETSLWTYYAKEFAGRYASSPRLQPLDVIFSKPDPVETLRQVRSAAREQAALGSSSSSASPSRYSAPATSTSQRPANSHIDVAGVTHAQGKRKASSASLQLLPGSGSITVNGAPLASYFRDPSTREVALAPLVLIGSETEYDIAVSVRGGGLAGQAAAVRTALARALCVQRPALGAGSGGGSGGSGAGGRLAAMTRWDGRVVERKKPGMAKARRGFQWVKR